MRTLYIRNVPDDVLARLERLAARSGASLSSVALWELAESTRRVDNEALFGALPDLGISTAEVLDVVHATRRSE